MKNKKDCGWGMVDYTPYFIKEEEMRMDIPKQTVKVEHHLCPHHQKNIGDNNYAGCTCSSLYSSVIIKDKRLVEKIEDEKLRERNDG